MFGYIASFGQSPHRAKLNGKDKIKSTRVLKNNSHLSFLPAVLIHLWNDLCQHTEAEMQESWGSSCTVILSLRKHSVILDDSFVPVRIKYLLPDGVAASTHCAHQT